jgi:SAM-dependent methyltransferase
MGISLNEAMIFREWFERRRIKGPGITLGVADIRFTWRDYENALARTASTAGHEVLTARQFFASIGIDELLSLDFNDYEGADVIFNLNHPSLPDHLTNRFGVVVNVGTLEHVFHVPNALANITRMLRAEGVAVHILPAHNAIDHGFYQFGPTLMFDY